MVKPKWKRFEELVAEVQKRLSPDAQVKHNDKIRGKSGVLRQVDVSVKDTIGQFGILIAVDCKDQKNPVDLPEIEQFVGLVQDIGANKGAVVSASGFSSSAVKKGRDAGLNLYRLVDVGEHEWKTFVTIPVLCDFRKMTHYNFKFVTKQSHISCIDKILQSVNDQRDTMLYDRCCEKIDRVVNFVDGKWGQSKMPISPGNHDVLFQNDPVYLKYDDIFVEVRVGIIYSVERELRLGFVPLEKISGFQNVVTGGIITDGFTTGGLDIREVRQRWQKVKSTEELAIRPVITVRTLNKIVH